MVCFDYFLFRLFLPRTFLLPCLNLGGNSLLNRKKRGPYSYVRMTVEWPQNITKISCDNLN